MKHLALTFFFSATASGLQAGPAEFLEWYGSVRDQPYEATYIQTSRFFSLPSETIEVAGQLSKPLHGITAYGQTLSVPLNESSEYALPFTENTSSIFVSQSLAGAFFRSTSNTEIKEASFDGSMMKVRIMEPGSERDQNGLTAGTREKGRLAMKSSKFEYRGFGIYFPFNEVAALAHADETTTESVHGETMYRYVSETGTNELVLTYQDGIAWPVRLEKYSAGTLASRVEFSPDSVRGLGYSYPAVICSSQFTSAGELRTQDTRSAPTISASDDSKLATTLLDFHPDDSNVDNSPGLQMTRDIIAARESGE